MVVRLGPDDRRVGWDGAVALCRVLGVLILSFTLEVQCSKCREGNEIGSCLAQELQAVFLFAVFAADWPAYIRDRSDYTSFEQYICSEWQYFDYCWPADNPSTLCLRIAPSGSR